jgi:hypothetical protein
MFSSEGWSFTFSTYPIRIRKNNGTLLPSVARIRHVYPTGNFLCSHKFHKILNYFCFEQVQKTVDSLPQKIVTKLSEIWIGDLESETHSPNPDPGVKKAPDPGSATLLLPKNCH